MKHLLALLMFLTTITSAQVLESLDSLKGKFALQMQVRENLDFTNFNGSGLAGKYHFSGDWALRFGVNFSVMDSESEQKHTVNDTTQIMKFDGASNFFRISTALIHYLTLQHDVTFGIGIGPFIQFGSDDFNRKEGLPGESGYTRSESTSDHFLYGLELSAGVEWFVRKNIGIQAEYVIDAISNDQEQEQTDYTGTSTVTDYTKTEGSYWKLDNSEFRLGVSVYF